MKDYYEILEINKKASNEMVENAYKVLSKKYKSEKVNSKKMNDLVEAYKVLSDSFLRKQYDLEIEKEGQEKTLNINKVPKKKTKIQNENKNDKNKNKQIKENNNKQLEREKNTQLISGEKFHTVKTLYGLTSDIFQFGKDAILKLKNKKMEREDWIAMGLTVVVMIILGVILWFIPFTNGWMREITVDSPLFRWIFKK